METAHSLFGWNNLATFSAAGAIPARPTAPKATAPANNAIFSFLYTSRILFAENPCIPINYIKTVRENKIDFV